MRLLWTTYKFFGMQQIKNHLVTSKGVSTKNQERNPETDATQKAVNQKLHFTPFLFIKRIPIQTLLFCYI